MADVAWAALIHIIAAILSLVTWGTGAVVAAIPVYTVSTICTWVGSTSINQGAVLSSESLWTVAHELHSAVDHRVRTDPSVAAGSLVAGVLELASVTNQPWAAHTGRGSVGVHGTLAAILAGPVTVQALQTLPDVRQQHAEQQAPGRPTLPHVAVYRCPGLSHIHKAALLRSF